MKSYNSLPAIDWVKRVNRTWLTKGKINESAERWLNYLTECNDGRLQKSCENARAMCNSRQPLNDPKPWFYAGLFSLATNEEAKRFISTHRITKAAVPSMHVDDEVILWLDRVGPETQELIEKIRDALKQLH